MYCYEKGVQEAVLKSISKTMSVTISKELITQELKAKLKNIVDSCNGNLSNSQAKLVDDGGVANMSEMDFA